MVLQPLTLLRGKVYPCIAAREMWNNEKNGGGGERERD